jgi:hypothetical protein
MLTARIGPWQAYVASRYQVHHCYIQTAAMRDPGVDKRLVLCAASPGARELGPDAISLTCLFVAPRLMPIPLRMLVCVQRGANCTLSAACREEWGKMQQQLEAMWADNERLQQLLETDRRWEASPEATSLASLPVGPLTQEVRCHHPLPNSRCQCCNGGCASACLHFVCAAGQLPRGVASACVPCAWGVTAAPVLEASLHGLSGRLQPVACSPQAGATYGGPAR